VGHEQAVFVESLVVVVRLQQARGRADMGTAFGLDASMPTVPAEIEPTSTKNGGRPPKGETGRKPPR
jgi:hypothetical protein